MVSDEVLWVVRGKSPTFSLFVIDVEFLWFSVKSSQKAKPPSKIIHPFLFPHLALTLYFLPCTTSGPTLWDSLKHSGWTDFNLRWPGCPPEGHFLCLLFPASEKAQLGIKAQLGFNAAFFCDAFQPLWSSLSKITCWLPERRLTFMKRTYSL